jgi:hypothetical protein
MSGLDVIVSAANTVADKDSIKQAINLIIYPPPLKFDSKLSHVQAGMQTRMNTNIELSTSNFEFSIRQ